MNKTPNTTDAAPGAAMEKLESISFYAFGLELENAYLRLLVQVPSVEVIEAQALKEAYKAELNNIAALYRTAKQAIAKQMEKIERLQNEVNRFREAENLLLLAEDILLDGLNPNPEEALHKIILGRKKHQLSPSARNVKEMLVGSLANDGIDIAKI